MRDNQLFHSVFPFNIRGGCQHSLILKQGHFHQTLCNRANLMGQTTLVLSHTLPGKGFQRNTLTFTYCTQYFVLGAL